MPIKAKQVSAEQAALVAKGFVSRDDRRTSNRQGEKNYFYTGEVRENERMEQELSSSDSNSSFTSSVASASSPPMPGKSKGKSSGPGKKKENGGGSSPGATFLTRGAENLASDVDSDEEALAEARRKTQQFLFPEREKNYKPPPRQVNQRLVEYEKTKRAAKIRREQEKEEAALLEEQQQQQGSVVPEQPYTPPPPTHDRAPAHGRMAHAGTSTALKEATVTDREAVAIDGDEPPKSIVTGPSSSSQKENRARPRVDRSESSSSEGPTENPDFERLLQLFGEDILWERREKEEEEARDRQQREYAKTARSAPRTSSSFKDDLDDLESRPRELYHRPANPFAELLDDALHRLYETWGNEDYDEGADDRPQFFVATDHLGEAFTMAATKIVSERSTSAPAGLHSSSAIGSTRVGDRAFSMEEVAALQAAQRNERRSREAGNSAFLPGGGYSADPEVLIADAHAKLDRYLDSVRWLEQLVRDGRFMSSVGQFLHQHHNTFLHHISESSPLDNTTKKAAPSSSIKSFSHEEYKIFTEFSNRIAKVVFQVLSSKVKDFDEAEFAENLFDTPVGRESIARLGYDVGPMNVVSYPAWRIMLSISNFESFVDWMTDYIREEYNLDNEAVSVAGPRGLHALIESTYRYKPPNGGGGGGAALPEDNAEEDSVVLLQGEAAGAKRNEKGGHHISSTRPPANVGGSPLQQQQPRLRGNSTTKDMDSTPMRKPSNRSDPEMGVVGSSPQPSSPSTAGSALVHTTENRKGSSPLLPLPLPTPPSSAGGSVSSIPPPSTITGATPASYTSARGASTVALVKKFGKPKKQPRDLPPISPAGSVSTDRGGKHPLGSQRSVDSADLPSVTHPSSAPTGTVAQTTAKGKPNRLGHAESPRAKCSTKRGASNSRLNVEAPPRRNPSVKKKKAK